MQEAHRGGARRNFLKARDTLPNEFGMAIRNLLESRGGVLQIFLQVRRIRTLRFLSTLHRSP